MAGDITIRAVEPRDYAVLAEIHNQPGVIAGTLILPFQTAHDIEQRFHIDANNRMLVAEIEGRVVGDAGLNLNRGRRSHSGSFGMAVRDDFQGRGVGTALLERLMDLADNWYNLLRVDLQVYVDNEPAIRLYQRFGFVIEGTMRSYAYRRGEFVDAYSMARLRNCPPVVDTSSTIEQIALDEAD